MHSYVQHHNYEDRIGKTRRGLPISAGSEECFGDGNFTIETNNLTTNQKHTFVAEIKGSQVFLLVRLLPDSPIHLLWSTFRIRDFHDEFNESGKDVTMILGQGWTLNPPQLLEGQEFENFLNARPARFGFRPIDELPYCQHLKTLADQYHRPEVNEQTREFCHWLCKLLPEDDDAFQVLSKVVSRLSPQIAEPEGLLPKSKNQSLEWVTRDIRNRRGQSSFRQKLLAAYGRRCAITGCDAEAALEAAHIRPFVGDATNVTYNGLLLRADIHTLFDLGLIRIDPESRRVVLHVSLEGTSYGELNGRTVSDPASPDDRPTMSALEDRWVIATESLDRIA